MNYRDNDARCLLKNNLMKLSKQQLKLFYGILVHGWACRRAFISTQDIFNLWCELNEYCHEADEGFPDPYGDCELLKSFCHAHPYYFIDILEPGLIANLFCEYLDNRLDILTAVAQKLNTEGLRAAYEYSNAVLNLADDIDESVAQIEEHIQLFP